MDNEAVNIKEYLFFQKLCQLNFIEAIWLYGSRARGDEHERSDIDIAIICPQATEDDWRKVLEVIEDADTLLQIDCVRFDLLPKDDNLRKNIMQDKKVLFERKKHQPDWMEVYLQVGEALDRLEEMVNEPEDKETYVKDATIHRFEFSIELFWKLLKKICQAEGYEVNSPRNTLQKAYQMKLISEEKIWLDMMNDRNMTSHTYKQSLANEIYQHIKNYFPLMKKNYLVIKKRYKL